MTDVRLKQEFTIEGPSMEWFVRDIGTLDDRDELATAVRVALGTDALASPDEVLPDPDSNDRRGWWGDFQAEEIWNGWPIGSKNWLLTRAKITETSSEGSTLDRARQYTINSLQPFIDQAIASQMSVDAERTDLQTIQVSATLFRGPLDEISLRYQPLWEEPEIINDVSVKTIISSIMRRIPYDVLSLSSLPPIISWTDNRQLTIPQGNVALSTTLLSMTPTLTLQGNVALSSVAPIVVSNTKLIIPLQGNLAMSETAPNRSP